MRDHSTFGVLPLLLHISRSLRALVPLVGFVGTTLGAQDITGKWQATLGPAPQPTRFVLQVTREGDGRLTAALFDLGQGFGSPIPALSITVSGQLVKASFPRGLFSGTLSTSRSTITGMWSGATSRGPAPPEPLIFSRQTPVTAWRDSSAHRVRFVRVATNIQLEVLDWGGKGRPVVLLTGAGNNAHVFDEFAPKLADRYHVYAITRRGFAPSSVPTFGYIADSLADDVLSVLDSLHLDRPILIGHSIAGQELSSIGSRHSDRVSGLVYLDAGYPYAFYDPSENNTSIVIPDALRKLTVIFDRWAPISFAERAAMIRELTDSTLPVLTRDLRLWANDLEAGPNAAARPAIIQRNIVASGIALGAEKYTHVEGPVLAIYAAPRPLRADVANDPAAGAKADSVYLAGVMPQIVAFQRGVPQARVVRIAHASHYVFQSNEAEVLREIRRFIDSVAVQR